MVHTFNTSYLHSSAPQSAEYLLAPALLSSLFLCYFFFLPSLPPRSTPIVTAPFFPQPRSCHLFPLHFYCGQELWNCELELHTLRADWETVVRVYDPYPGPVQYTINVVALLYAFYSFVLSWSMCVFDCYLASRWLAGPSLSFLIATLTSFHHKLRRPGFVVSTFY